ncbi:cytochrome P450 [Trichoderma novae-zelandiae]
MTTPIPKPPGVPLLGNIFDVKPSNTWDSVRKLADKYGEIFQIKVLGQTIVFVASAALADELCDEKRFRKYVGGPVVEIRAAVHDALFTAYDDEPNWGVAHRIIYPQLSPEVMSGRFGEMRDLATELFNAWRGLGDKNTISPVEQLNRLNLESTTYVLFGKRLNTLIGPPQPELQAMEDSTSEAMKRPTRPGVLNWLLYGRKFKSSIKIMRDYAADVVKHRQENPTDRQDVLAAMMNTPDPETGKTLTESQVIDEIVSMPIGSSTAPCLLAWAIYFLEKNPEAIVRAREELDRVLGDGELGLEHLEQLEYVQGIMRESLRLSSAAPGFNIEPRPKEGDKSPVLLGRGKYQVAHNQAMIIVLHGVNRDPAVFDDPLAFKPECMVGEAFETLPAAAKKWFGNGKRVCIGRHYALQWSLIVLAKMIREFDFELADPEYKLELDGWFNIRPIDFYVKVKPRAT